MNYDDYIKESLPFEAELSQYYSSGDALTIFEIGSCEGEDSIRLKKKFPRATIYTFEPLPNNIKIIQKNFRRYGLDKDHLYQLALGEKNGQATFYVSSGHPDHLPKVKGWDYGNKSSSLLPPKKHKEVLKWVKFKEKIKVKTQRLDSFCAEQSVDRIDFIYLDVQGAELMVLRGAGDMLSKVGAIWMEVEAVELYANQPLKKEVETFMKKNGFIRVKDTVDDISGDQLYVHSSLKKIDTLSKMKAGMSKLFRRH